MTDVIRDFSPQSYKWGKFRVIIDSVISDPRQFAGVRLLKQEAGNLTVYAVKPGGDWSGAEVDWDGNYEVSKQSTGEVIFALACSGHWSGGGTYRGFVFGKPGAVAFFSCKGKKRWLVFTDTGPKWCDTEPGEQPVEL